MTGKGGLHPAIIVLLDHAVEALKQAHDLALLIESGKALTDYLRMQHDLEIYRHDLEDGAAVAVAKAAAALAIEAGTA